MAAAAGCASTPREAARAPSPLGSIAVERLYVGRWYEIARTPMRITRDCVAGTTDYSRLRSGQIFDTDACRMGTPEGRKKTFAGPVTLLNPGQNTKMRVSYRVWHLFHVSRVYWILDHDDGYRWFILSDPSFEHISLFTREPRPPAADVARLVARAAALGYDTSKLEYPAEFPAADTGG
ncbi:MAG TPA: lipocalin family protein [Steroidobacteraceae bacterium]|nr:lipocalin family protein [Steroidobacteraceae bacterium]